MIGFNSVSMTRRVSQREHTEEAQPSDTLLTKRHHLEEDRWSHVADALENHHGCSDDVKANTKPQFVVLHFPCS